VLQENSERRWAWAAWGVFALALTLRLWGITFGIPNLIRIDEEAVVGAMTTLWYTMNPKPFLTYPTLTAHMVQVIWLPVYLILRGSLGNIKYNQFVFSAEYQPYIHLTARIYSAFASAATVFPLVRLGHLLSVPWVGLGAAVLWAVAFLPVRDGHFGLADSMVTLACTWCVVACVSFIVRRQATGGAVNVRGAVFVGATVAWAFAAKYSAPAVVVGAATLILACRSGKELLWAVVAAAGTTLVLFPEGVLHPDLVVEIARFQRWSTSRFEAGNPVGWVYFATFTLPYGMGWPLTILSLVGFVVGVARFRWTFVPVILFAAFHYGFQGHVRGIFSRHLDPMLPVMCFAAALAVWAAYDFLKARAHPTVAKAVAAGLFALMVVPNLLNSLAMNALFAAKDTQTQTTEFLLARDRKTPVYTSGVVIALPGRSQATMVKPETLDALRAAPPDPTGAGCYLVTAEYAPGFRYGSPPDEREAVAALPDCEEVATFSPFRGEGIPELVTERHDLWFAPMAQFERVKSLGPLIRVYHCRRVAGEKKSVVRSQ
jgi:hypothetical protein